MQRKTVSSEFVEAVFQGLKPSTVYQFEVEAYSNGLSSPPKRATQKTGNRMFTYLEC